MSVLFIRLEEIFVNADRQRQYFDPEAQVDLEESIRSLGLINPVTVRKASSGYELVAGERRFRALKTILATGGSCRFQGAPTPTGTVPCLDFGTLDPLVREEVELDENLKRIDLTWQERTSALARLHRLRTGQAEAEGKPHLLKDTAEEVFGASGGWHTAEISDALMVERHLSNPEVAKAKSKEEAVKVIKAQAKKESLVQQAAVIGKTFSASAHKLVHGDCLDWLASCPAEQFDVILTDPPYGMGAQNFGDSGGRMSLDHGYDDSPEAFRKLMSVWIPESYRVAKKEAHLWMFCDIQHFEWLQNFLRIQGWYVFRTPLIAAKPQGRVPIVKYGIRRSYELILFAAKGERETLMMGNDVIQCKMEGDTEHAAQKPVDLLTNLLQRSARPGDTVLDTFMGSGSTVVAGHELKLSVTGIEQDAASYAIAQQRVAILKGA